MCQVVVGYCRVSTNRQSISRQIRNIKALYPDCKIIQEVYTGTKLIERKEWEKLFNLAMNGKVDKIVFDSVSRMSRNADEGFSTYKQLFERGVSLEFIKEPYINTDTYKDSLEKQIEVIKTGNEATDCFMKSIIDSINVYMMKLAEQQIKLAFQQAEKEVKDLHIKVSEGLLTAKLAGKQIGAEKGRKNKVKKADPAKEQIKRLSKSFNGTLTDTEVRKIVGIANNTYYKYKKEILAEMFSDF